LYGECPTVRASMALSIKSLVSRHKIYVTKTTDNLLDDVTTLYGKLTPDGKNEGLQFYENQMLLIAQRKAELAQQHAADLPALFDPNDSSSQESDGAHDDPPSSPPSSPSTARPRRPDPVAVHANSTTNTANVPSTMTPPIPQDSCSVCGRLRRSSADTQANDEATSLGDCKIPCGPKSLVSIKTDPIYCIGNCGNTNSTITTTFGESTGKSSHTHTTSSPSASEQDAVVDASTESDGAPVAAAPPNP
jgi:hypothetical protein